VRPFTSYSKVISLRRKNHLLVRVFLSVTLFCLGINFGKTDDDIENIQKFVREVASKHGLEEEYLATIISSAEKQQSILDAFKRPATSRPWHYFRERYVTDYRIEEGVKFWSANQAVLDQATEKYGVPQEIIVALIGVETNYGSFTGTHRVLDALFTLGFYGERRNKYFLSELEQFILMARDNQLDPLEVRGSFAGALGIAQFMPSSYREYAIDFDGDGRADLGQSVADAVGSVANYLARFGWAAHGNIASLVSIPEGNEKVETLVGSSKPRLVIKDLQDVGLSVPDIDSKEKVALISLAAIDGNEYWVTFQNFYSITRYNPSQNYAMAVFQLSTEIKGKRGI
jgi:membrane-bound lytic murein transglycosylase B